MSFHNHRFPLLLLSLTALPLIAGCGGEQIGHGGYRESSGAEDGEAEAVDRELADAGPAPLNLTASLEGTDVRLTWDELNPGDYNGDGAVNGLDLFPLASNFQEPVAGNPGNQCVDGNGDGALTGLDVFPIATNFGNNIDEYRLYYAAAADSPFDQQLNLDPIDYVGCSLEQQYLDMSPDLPRWYVCRSIDNDGGGISAQSNTAHVESATEIIVAGIPTVNEPFTEIASSPDGMTIGLTYYLEEEGEIVYMYREGNSGPWMSETVATGSPYSFGAPQLAFSPSGEPGIAWTDYDFDNPPEDYRIGVALRVNSDWTIETVLTDADAWEPDFGFTWEGYPSLAYTRAFDKVYYGVKEPEGWSHHEVPRGTLPLGSAKPALYESRGLDDLPTSIAFFHDDYTPDGMNPTPSVLWSFIPQSTRSMGEFTFENVESVEALETGLFLRELVNFKLKDDEPEAKQQTTWVKSNGPQRGVDSAHRLSAEWAPEQVTGDEEEGNGLDVAERPWNGRISIVGYTWFDPLNPSVSHLRLQNPETWEELPFDYTFHTMNYTSVRLAFSYDTGGTDVLNAAYWDQDPENDDAWYLSLSRIPIEF